MIRPPANFPERDRAAEAARDDPGGGEAVRRALDAERDSAAQDAADNPAGNAHGHPALRPDSLEALKENFLSMVSHELRSPITVIGGFIRLLRDGRAGELNPQQTELLGRTLVHAERMTVLVNDLILYAEIESGLLHAMTPTEVDPVAAVRAAVKRAIVVRPAGAAALALELPESAPPILADRECVEKILFHLMDNALKFSASAPVRVRIERVGGDGASGASDEEGKRGGGELGGDERGDANADAKPAGGRLRFVVEDEGVGIKPELVGRIFDRFTQLEAVGDRHHDGLGMGLALAARLARLSGGEIDIASEPGKGSVFGLTYPVAGAG